MSKPTEQEIEHVSRAMCEAFGLDPEAQIEVLEAREGAKAGETYAQWQDYTSEAIRFLAGYRAMQEWA